MSINVYWSCLEDEWMRAAPPTPIIKEITKKLTNKKDKNSYFPSCPSFRDEVENTFSIKSLYNFDFEIKGDSVVSSQYDQDFFDKHLMVRDLNQKIFSFKNFYIFFSDSKNLEMSMIHPFFENNNISKYCNVVPGKFNISKWYRPIDFAFMIKDSENSFSIKENDAFSYIKFHTKEKINFVQYIENQKLKDYRYDVLNSRHYSSLKNDLGFYYNIFKIKKNILKEIKENIVL